MAAFEDTLPPVAPNPLLTINRKLELTHQQQMNLIILSQNPQMTSFWELADMEIIIARDKAMAIDPSKPIEQAAAMTVAHSMAKFCESLKERIRWITAEHLNEAKRLDMEKKLGTPEEIERIIMEQLMSDLRNT
jgi:hypothetical protein